MTVLRGVRAGLLLFLVCSPFSPAACGGPTEPAKQPDPVPLDDGPGPGGHEQGASAAPSSAKVDAGMKAIEKKDFAEAKTVLAAAHADNPKDPQAAYYLGVAEEGLGETDAAADAYKAALALDGKLVEAAVNLSAILLDKQDAKGALDVINGGLAVAPKHPGLLLNRALVLEATGDAGAAKAYGAAADAAPDNAELRYTYAELLARAGKKSEAVAELKKLEGADAKVEGAAGNLYGQLGAFAECVAAIDKAIGAGATAALHVVRGACRHEMHDDAGAEKDYQAAIGLDAKFALAHYYLGQHHRAKGKKKEALAELKLAAELAKGTKLGAKAEKELAEIK